MRDSGCSIMISLLCIKPNDGTILWHLTLALEKLGFKYFGQQPVVSTHLQKLHVVWGVSICTFGKAIVEIAIISCVRSAIALWYKHLSHYVDAANVHLK